MQVILVLHRLLKLPTVDVTQCSMMFINLEVISQLLTFLFLLLLLEEAMAADSAAMYRRMSFDRGNDPAGVHSLKS